MERIPLKFPNICIEENFSSVLNLRNTSEISFAKPSGVGGGGGVIVSLPMVITTGPLQVFFAPTLLLYQKKEKNIPRKEIARTDFYIHIYVSDLYIPTISLPILLQQYTGCGR